MHQAFSLTAIGLVLCISSTVRAAQPDYPHKPIKFIVPVTAGGGVDTTARLIANQLKESLGQPVIVENRPGAGGSIGLRQLATSEPDGYTLAFVPNSFTINHSLMRNLPFDTFKSFEPVIQVAKAPVFVAARADLPASTLNEVVQMAQKQPDGLSFAGCDTGSALHLSAEYLKQVTGTKITHIPFKGCADSVPNVIGGQVDLLFISYSNIQGHLQSGRLKPLAVAASRRVSYAPHIPTGAEQGVQGFEMEVWYGVLAPKKIPLAILTRLNEAMNEVLNQPEIRERLSKNYLTVSGGSAHDFARAIHNDVERYAEVVRRGGIKID
jgi:tripartite-type tricarboxylate transporter receptor subunit TctC